MRAVLFAHHSEPSMAAIADGEPVAMVPLVDRPFLQHVVEVLVQLGVKELHLVLSDRPETVEAFVGDGKRWGVTVRTHLVRNPEQPYGVLKTLGLHAHDADGVLAAHADCIPGLVPGSPVRVGSDQVYCHKERWTGWAWLRSEDVRALPPRATREELAALLLREPARREDVDHALSVRTYAEYLEAQRLVLRGAFPGLLRTGREVASGVWLSRNSVVDRTARVLPPVFIGPDTRVGAGVRLGPDVVVGAGCVIESGTQAFNAAVLPGSFVGEGLELADTIVKHDRVVNVALQAEARVQEPFIVGAVRAARPGRWFARLLGRLWAAALLLLSAPVLAWTLALRVLSGRPGVVRHEVAQLPREPGRAPETFTLPSLAEPGDAEAGLGHLVRRVLPGLWAVVAGKADLVGLPPRTPEELSALPEHWRGLVLSSRVGLITEAQVQFGAAATEPERLAAEAYYASVAGWAHDLRLLGRYLQQVVAGGVRP